MLRQGRNLQLNHRGEEVEKLRGELTQLGFKITDPPGFFGSTTLAAVRKFQADNDLPATGIFEARTAQRIKQALGALPRQTWRVQGRLLQPDGAAMPNTRVRAFEKRLRRDVALGEATPDSTGQYGIDYPIPRDGDVSLYVQAFDAAGKRIAASELVCHADPLQTVDLVAGDAAMRGASLFARLQSALRPLLAVDNVVAADLAPDDVAWLVCRHHLDEQALGCFTDAARLARDAQLPREHEAFFGLLVQGLPATLDRLIAQSPDSLRLALGRALEDNVVGAALLPRVPQIVDALQAIIVRLALRDPTPEQPSFALLFELADTPRAQREGLLTDYTRHKGSVAEFWNAQRARLGAEGAAELQHMVRLGALTMDHEPLLRELARMRTSGEIGRGIEDLARLSRDDWQRLLQRQVGGRRIGAPAFLGPDETRRIPLYATFLARYVEASAPTRVLAERLAIDTPGAVAPALPFLRRHPSFDFRSRRVDEFLRANPTALAGEADPGATRSALQAMQRLLDVAPVFDAYRTVRLIEQGIDSATLIRRLGETAFVARAAQTLGSEREARTVYAKAALKADTALMLLSQTAFVTPTPVKAIPPQLLGPGIPDLEDLFGSLDACACEHCASVYSPAAYLVDILHFLMNLSSSRSGRSALDVMFERRPDIGEVELDCDNTHTTLPYVDLVVEILENAVAPGAGFPFQTDGDASDLLASPAHVNAQAYDGDHLAGAVYPWSLPLDLWTETARGYLQHLGVPRHELMQRFRARGDAARAADLAAEVLVLASADRTALAATSVAARRAAWGFSDAAGLTQLLQSRNAAVVLQRARMSYDELVAALDVAYVNPADNLRVAFAGADCNLDTATIANLNAAALDRLHRFMRLQRRLSWSIEELGAILAALEISGVIDDAAVIRLAGVKRLQQDLRAPLHVMASWWAQRIDTRDTGARASLYDSVFLDPTASQPVADVFRLNSNRDELTQAAVALISGNLPQVHAALGISAVDLELLLADLPDDRLNLRNLTRLHAAVAIAKAFGLRIADALILRALSGTEPVGSAAATAATVRFAELTQFVRDGGYPLPLLDYLLRHRFVANASFGFTDSEIADRLGRLRATLRTADAELALAPVGVDTTAPNFEADPDGARTATHLAALLPVEATNRALALVRRDALHGPADPAAFIAQEFAPFLDPAEAVARLIGPGMLTGTRERFNYVLDRLLSHLRAVARERVAIAWSAETFEVAAGLGEAMLRTLVRSPADGSRPIIADLTAHAFVGSPDEPAAPQIDRSAFPLLFAGCERLHKLVQAIGLFGLDDATVNFAVADGPARGWLDIATLPLAPIDGAQEAFARFVTMARALQAGRALPGGLSDFVALLRRQDNAGIDRAGYLDEVALRTGWDRADLEFVAGPQVLGLNWPQDFRSGVFLADLQPCSAQLRRLGVAAVTASAWSATTLTPDAARTIVQAARAKYPNKAGWIAVARALRDPLRERQRVALVDYLVQQHGLRAASDLYGHYLVDVEMSPCMLTSRMLLATASAQLFVQRCLLNLEADVPPSAIDTQQWDWMKNYRVWEANRKVFLYPENWIEPELRDDKSPFFLALEQGLLQDEVTAAVVEREYLKYLEALDQVANLEIAGLTVGKWGLLSNVVHVFGRTRNTPRHHFYRRWDGSAWTPWEPLEVGIEGDHLVPVIWNGRLNLFWPTFMEKALEPGTLDSDSPEWPQKYYEIKLAWSEHREGAWTAKRVTDEAVETAIMFGLFGPPSLVRFHEAIRDHSFVSSPTPDGAIEIGVLLRLTGGDTNANPNELTLDGAFRLSAIGDVEAITSSETQKHAWAPSRRFPATRLYRNKIREQASHTGFSAQTTSSSLHSTDAALVLEKSPGRFSVVFPQHERPFFCRLPFFYQDPSRTFFVVPDGRYLLDDNSGSPLGGGGGFVPVPSGSGAQPGAALSLDLPVRVTAFHANVATMALAGTTAPASAAAGGAVLPGHWETTSFLFRGHQHPFVRMLIEQLNRFGLDGILRPTPKMEPALAGSFGTLRRQAVFRPYFWTDYAPNRDTVENVRDIAPGLLAGLAQIAALQPRDDFDFSFDGAYSIYNWELFFHAPFMIAKRLSANRRFEEAHRWFNYVFDPTDAPEESDAPAGPDTDRVWNVKPFVEHGRGRTIQRLMLLLKSTGLSAEEKRLRKELNDQVKAWRKHPFNPHLIARMRVQPYMMAVVMAYLDNLIAWADDLFRRDTMESISEASQLYVLAAEILGERPREIAAHEGTRRTINGQVVTTFNDLRGHLDAFSNALVALEGIIYPGEADQGVSNSGGLLHANDFVTAGSSPAADLDFAAPVPSLVGPTLFFCIPRNDKLVGYWDTVADRLFKIRHCMNIEGVVRQLPLFQPPIDPALLVKAAASGLDIGSVVADLHASLPSHRFQTLVQKARDVVAGVKALGGALLAALEKKDGEELGLVRARHETGLLAATRGIKQRSVEEAQANLTALTASRAAVAFRQTFYATREHTNAKEQLHQKKLENAFALQTTSQALELLAGALALIPQFDAGISGAFGTPVVKIKVGGFQFSTAVQVASRALQLAAAVETYRANKASIEGGYDRRQEDWDFQAASAGLEVAQIDRQAEAAQIRLAIAEQELKNHDLQVANSESIEAYLRDKYTNAELYGWMIGQLSALYFQAHQLALDIARSAERCFRHELGLPQSSYVSPGNWDSLRKGLLAGEKLEIDLQRLEAAWLDKNRREYELTKHVSLRQLDPLALLSLKATGACEFAIPEYLLDLDGPGHYFRRIKAVSLSLPCVVGPYASVNCTASLISSSVRTSSQLAGGYARDGEDTARFTDYFGTIQSVVTSGASNDSGLFDTNLRDERYLPFEGSGAIGRWRLELPADFRQFDYATLSDVLLHVRYTAREGGAQLRAAAVENLAAALSAANEAAPVVLISLRNDCPSEWHRFLNGNVLTIGVGRDRFTYIAQGHAITVRSIAFVSLTADAPVPVALSAAQVGLDQFPTLGPSDPTEMLLQFPPDAAFLERSPSANPFLLLRYSIQ